MIVDAELNRAVLAATMIASYLDDVEQTGTGDPS